MAALACAGAACLADGPKYVFLFIGDGMSVPQRMVADEYSRAIGEGPLAINGFPVQAYTRTACADSLITDSAAAATSIACGEKTRSGRIGRDAEGKRDLESVAQVAKKKGKKVGIISSVTINHATPAGFYGKRNSRSQYYELGLDLIASGFDYFGGGAIASCNNTNSPAYKGDVYELAKQAGFTVARGRQRIMGLEKKNLPCICSCDGGALPYWIDGYGESLRLDEYVAKGIELLDNPDGFFMMVEGGSLDWNGHSNDPGGNVGETLALDKAVKVALEFMKKHDDDDTLIIVTGDHETGGMTMGFANTKYKLYVELLKKQKCTAEKFGKLVKAAKAAGGGWEEAKKLLAENWGFEFEGEPKAGTLVLTEKEKKSLEAAFGDPSDEKSFAQSHSKLAATARRIFSEHCGIGWTSGSHTALPVMTSAIGEDSDKFGGVYENTEIANRLKKVLLDD